MPQNVFNNLFWTIYPIAHYHLLENKDPVGLELRPPVVDFPNPFEDEDDEFVEDFVFKPPPRLFKSSPIL